MNLQELTRKGDEPSATFAERFGQWWDFPSTRFHKETYPYPQEEVVQQENERAKVPGETKMPWTWERFHREYPQMYEYLKKKHLLRENVPPMFEENVLTPEQIRERQQTPASRQQSGLPVGQVAGDPTGDLQAAATAPTDPTRVDPTSRFAQWLGSRPTTPERGFSEWLAATPVAMRLGRRMTPEGVPERTETGGGVPIGRPLGEEFTLGTLSSKDLTVADIESDNTPGRWETKTGPYRFHRFMVKNEKGRPAGEFQITIDGTPDEVGKATTAHVSWAESYGQDEGAGESWTVGPKGVLSIIRQLKQVYPNLEKLESERVTGGRAESGKADTKAGQKATFDISKYAGVPWVVLPGGAIAFGASREEARAEERDYDYEAAQAAGVKPDARGHLPDTFKLPNHITFSNESQYSDAAHQGGQWRPLGGDRWEFTPGPENLKHHSMEELREYFKKYEPDSTLVEPDPIVGREAVPESIRPGPKAPGFGQQVGSALMSMPEIRVPAAIGRAVGQVAKEDLDALVESMARSLGAEAQGQHDIPDLMGLAGTVGMLGTPISRAAGTVGDLGAFAATKPADVLSNLKKLAAGEKLEEPTLKPKEPPIEDPQSLESGENHIKNMITYEGGKQKPILMSWEEKALTQKYGDLETAFKSLGWKGDLDFLAKKTEKPKPPEGENGILSKAEEWVKTNIKDFATLHGSTEMPENKAKMLLLSAPERDALTQKYGSLDAALDSLGWNKKVKDYQLEKDIAAINESLKGKGRPQEDPAKQEEHDEHISSQYPRYWADHYKDKGYEYTQRLLANKGINVTPEGAASINYYIGSGYRRLNRRLRSGDLTPEYERYRDTLSTALRALPPYEGTTWRGVSDKVYKFDQYVPGFEFTDPAFMSSSLREGDAFGRAVRFIISNRTGRDLVSTGINTSESEVLHPHGARFRVIDRENDEGKLNIYLEEIEDEPPMGR